MAAALAGANALADTVANNTGDAVTGFLFALFSFLTLYTATRLVAHIIQWAATHTHVAPASPPATGLAEQRPDAHAAATSV
jgi:hypothetical protein